MRSSARDRQRPKQQLRVLRRCHFGESLRLAVTPVPKGDLCPGKREAGTCETRGRSKVAPRLDSGETRSVEQIVEGGEKQRLELAGWSAPR